MHFERFGGVARLLGRIGRLSVFCGSVVAVGSIFGARVVYAAMAAQVSESNVQMMSSGAMPEGDYRVRFNGESMMVSSQMSDLTIHEALEKADLECRERSGMLGRDVAKLPKALVTTLAGTLFGILRAESTSKGYVACIVRDDDAGVAQLLGKAAEMSRTMDVSAFGRLHVMTAQRGPNATRTHLLREWTEGSFTLTKMFPAEGDTPGADLALVPRPDGSRRVLDATVEHSPFGVKVYDAPGGADEVLRLYDQSLPAKGWRVIPVPEAPNSEQARPGLRIFERRDADLVITATARGGRSVVSVASLATH